MSRNSQRRYSLDAHFTTYQPHSDSNEEDNDSLSSVSSEDSSEDEPVSEHEIVDQVDDPQAYLTDPTGSIRRSIGAILSSREKANKTDNNQQDDHPGDIPRKYLPLAHRNRRFSGTSYQFLSADSKWQVKADDSPRPPLPLEMNNAANVESDATNSDDDWDRGGIAGMSIHAMNTAKSDNPPKLIDPSLYQQIGFVVRSNLSQKPESIAEMNLALQALRRVWEAHCYPPSQQVLKYKTRKFVDICLYRHERSSIVKPGVNPALRELRDILNQRDSALAILRLDGLTSDAKELARFLRSCEKDTMLYFFANGKVEYNYTSKQLALLLGPARDTIIAQLNATKEIETKLEKKWALLRTMSFGTEIDPEEEDPRTVTPRLAMVMEAMKEEDLVVEPGLKSVLSTQMEKVTREMRNLQKTKKQSNAPLLALVSAFSQEKFKAPVIEVEESEESEQSEEIFVL